MGLYVTLAALAAMVLIAALIVVYGGESETAPQTTGGKVSPEQCSVMQLNREGEALVAQYGQDKRIDHLHSAISTYHAALKLCETGRWPLESAVTRNNTGTAYGILSGEEDGEKNLKLAVEMFEGAMKKLIPRLVVNSRRRWMKFCTVC